MAVLSEPSRSFRAVLGRNGSTLSCALFVLAVLVSSVLEEAALDRSLPRAVWLLSFWHYYLYWLAFAFGAVPFDVFKRDAVLMKTVSVLALAAIYLAQPLDLASLVVIAGGILLNARAAAVLGFDRTYYGHEVAGLPPKRISAFPYSVTSHPMILGNIAAFGGTLINPEFARHWGPLAGLHVALNIGLLVMELVGPGRRRAVRIGGAVAFAGVLLCVIREALPTTLTGVLLAAAAVACAGTVYRRYTQDAARRAS